MKKWTKLSVTLTSVLVLGGATVTNSLPLFNDNVVYAEEVQANVKISYFICDENDQPVDYVKPAELVLLSKGENYTAGDAPTFDGYIHFKTTKGDRYGIQEIQTPYTVYYPDDAEDLFLAMQYVSYYYKVAGTTQTPPPSTGGDTGSGSTQTPPPSTGGDTGSGSTQTPPPSTGGDTGSGSTQTPPPSTGGDTGSGSTQTPPPTGGGTGSGSTQTPPPSTGGDTGSGTTQTPPPSTGGDTGSGSTQTISTDKSKQAPSTTETKTGVSVSQSTTSETKKVLPNTGERTSVWKTIVGLILMAVVSIQIAFRRKKQ